MKNDLETLLSDALSTLPGRQSRPATIGGQLGIDAAAIGIHTRRTRRRAFVDGQGQANAAALITRLPRPSESMHFVLDGSFRLSETLPIIAQHIGEPAALTICSLGLNDDCTDLLSTMLKAGTVTELRLALSSYFKASDATTANRAVEVLTGLGAKVAIARVHAKIQLWRPATKAGRYVLETSSNLRSCMCIEQASIANDPGLFRWHDKWLTQFFQRHAITPSPV